MRYAKLAARRRTGTEPAAVMELEIKLRIVSAAGFGQTVGGGAMSGERTAEGDRAECVALAAAWPRALIADGTAPGLAAWWVGSRHRAAALGQPGIARHRWDRSIEDGLFDVRRARQLARGLEGAETLLAAEEVGLKKAAGSQLDPDRVRISRLLLVSGDGSERFYHQVERLHARFANRLEVLLLDCDEEALGAAAFGQGKRARALLIHHKNAVVRFLSILDVTHHESKTSVPD